MLGTGSVVLALVVGVAVFVRYALSIEYDDTQIVLGPGVTALRQGPPFFQRRGEISAVIRRKTGLEILSSRGRRENGEHYNDE